MILIIESIFNRLYQSFNQIISVHDKASRAQNANQSQSPNLPTSLPLSWVESRAKGSQAVGLCETNLDKQHEHPRPSFLDYLGQAQDHRSQSRPQFRGWNTTWSFSLTSHHIEFKMSFPQLEKLK